MTRTAPPGNEPESTPMGSYHPPRECSPTSPARSRHESQEEPIAGMAGDGSIGDDTTRSTQGMDENMRRILSENE